MSLFNPKNARVGGKLVDNVDADVTFETVLYDYNGTVAVPVPAIHLHGVVTASQDESLHAIGSEFDEYYSAGKAEEFAPTGKYFTIRKEGARLSDQSKAMALFVALQNSGIPEETFDAEDVTLFNGNYSLTRKRETREFKNRAGQKETKESSILLPTAVNEGVKKVKNNAKAYNGAAKDRATSIVSAIIAEKGVVPSSQLGAMVFNKVSKDKDAQAIVKAAIDQSFLAAGPWQFENGVLSSTNT